MWLSNALLWFDIFIPKDDPLWRDDISRSMWWVGQFVANALTKEGLTGLHVHRGAMLRVPGSGTVCWLGTGPGEVVVRNAHTVAKVVGIAQRRTRYAALFQVGVALRPSQFQLGGLFDIDPNVIEASEPPIGLAAPGVSRALDRDRLVASAIASLPDWSM